MDFALSKTTTGLLDIGLDGPDFKIEQGLKSAVIVSLFTDARAHDDDIIPDGTTNRRGHWADAFRERSLGSRLWLLSREKQLPSVLDRAQQYASEALQWLIDDNVAETVDVTTDFPYIGRLGIYITIIKADGSRFQYTFDFELKGN
ncbi:phage GP46 family protein [Methylophaga nitratireducenticrescens]|uniref:phage GP46 family protein n=1 Tax=Methylophaga nitratireducenticrescens TaxID=754476 RepID=UPI000CDC4196|nr:phage GP46 family protein [Methylophaga nitratireducenticrescens]AUZ85783.1 hypothetical protein CDW43_14965 [Methylophaga nitratireducenticrescens]AUZ85840.1 hypothetical protein CDW43_15265 [Methylophaga nitratireducenticrescens]